MKKQTITKLISAGLITALMLTGCAAENNKEDAQTSADTQTVQLTENDTPTATTETKPDSGTVTTEEKVEETVQAEEDKEETDAPDEKVSEDEDVNEDGIIGGAEKYEGDKTEEDNVNASTPSTTQDSSDMSTSDNKEETSNVGTSTGGGTSESQSSGSNNSAGAGSGSTSSQNTGNATTSNTGNSGSGNQATVNTGDSNTIDNASSSQNTGNTGTSNTDNSASNSQTTGTYTDGEGSVVSNPVTPTAPTTTTDTTTQESTVEETYTYETVLCPEMLTLVNDRRTNVYGTNTLAWDSELETNALTCARGLADNFVHPKGRDTGGTEDCIAMSCGYWDATQIHDAYVESEAHDRELHLDSNTKMVSATCYKKNSKGEIVDTYNIVILNDDYEGGVNCDEGDQGNVPFDENMEIIW